MIRSDFRVCIAVGFGLLGALGASVAMAQNDPLCQCRAPGGAMRDLGTVECVDIAGRKKMVMCTMSTNTPYWKDVLDVDGCPTA